MAFSSSWIYQIVDKFSRPAAKIARAAEKISKTVDKTGKRVAAAGKRIDKTSQSMQVLATSSGTASRKLRFTGRSLGVVAVSANAASASFARMGNTSVVASKKAVASISSLQSKMGELVVVAGVAFAAALPIKHAIAFEDAMADVNKVVDFKAPDGLKILGNQILEMSKTIPVAADELAKVAAVAGQMGIAENDIAEFTKTATKMATAFGLTAEEVAISTSKIANIFKIPVKEFERFGDTINHISNNSVASADELLRALRNKGAAAGKQMGLTADRSAAVAGSFIAMGVNAERVGSLMQGLGRGLNKVSAEFPDFALLAKKDPIDAMKLLGKALSKLSDVQKRVQLDKIFGVDFAPRVSEFLDSIAGGDGVVDSMIELASSTKKMGSVQREFDKRIATTGAKMQMMKNSIAAVAIKIGTKMLPAVNFLIDIIKKAALSIEAFTERTGNLVPILLGVVLGLVALKVAMIIGSVTALAFGGAITMVSGVIGFLTTVVTVASVVIRNLAVVFRVLSLALLANPIGLVILAIAGLVAWVISAKEVFGTWTGAIINVGRTILKFLLAPIKMVVQAFDFFAGTDFASSFDAISDSLQKAGAELIGFGSEFDAVVAKERQIALAADISTNAGKAGRVSATNKTTVGGEIGITLNDPSGAVQSVAAKSKGPVAFNMGQNMVMAS